MHSFDFHSQLLPLERVSTDPWWPSGIPARLTVSGCVTGVESQMRTFDMNIRQILECACEFTSLKIRAVTTLNTSTTSHFNPLPSLNSVVSMTGDIMAVRDGVLYLAIDDLGRLRPRRPVLRTPVART